MIKLILVLALLFSIVGPEQEYRIALPVNYSVKIYFPFVADESYPIPPVSWPTPTTPPLPTIEIP